MIFPHSKNEDIQIGRAQYDRDKDAPALNVDIQAAVDHVREFLKVASAGKTTPHNAVDILVTNLKKLGNPTNTPTANSPALIKAWENFTDTIIGAPPRADTLVIALKATIAAQEHLLLSNQLRKQREKSNEDAAAQDKERARLLAKEEAEKNAAKKKAVSGGNVRNLIEQFEAQNKKPASTPANTAKRPATAKKGDGDDDAAKKRKKDEEEAATRKRKEDEEAAKKRREDEEAHKRQADEDAAKKRQEEADAARRRAEEEASLTAKVKSPVTMHQQTMTQTVVPVPTVYITTVNQLDHVLAAAKAVSDKKELKEINKLFSQFHQQALLASDPVTRSLEVRQKLLSEWNNNLLPLQSELLDRIATLEVLLTTLEEAKNFAANGKENGESIKAREGYLAEIDKRIIAASNALDSYKNTLEECNNIEVGLASTNVTVYNDPEYEGQTNVAASVVKKILASEDRAAALDSMRADLGKKIDARHSGSVAFGLSTAAFEYEHAKIDTTRDYTLLGFIGTDSKQVNAPHGDVSNVRLQSNLNTIYSLSAKENDRQ